MALTQSHIDGLRSKKVHPQGLFIRGRSVASRDGAALDVKSPIDGSLLTTIGGAHAEDVDDAAIAARSTFEGGTWSRTAPAERKRLLLRLADLIEAHALELAVLGVRDNGTEISMAYKAEPLSAAAGFRWYAEAIDKVYGEIAPTAHGVLGLIHREHTYGGTDITVPLGGFRQSGFGRDKSLHAFDAYTDLKTAWIAL